MATNLLLEGDDLEALLIKAHSEGGPHARIVRADKYRHGGLWGFFARERFEVAVEIPDSAGSAFHVSRPAGTGADAAAASSAASSAYSAAAYSAAAYSAAADSAAASYPAASYPAASYPAASYPAASYPAASYPAAARQQAGAARRPVDRTPDPLTDPLPTLLPTDGATWLEPDVAEVFAAALASDVDHRGEEPFERAMDRAFPPVAALAAGGLLGIADRVSAAEEAAARSLAASARSEQVEVAAPEHVAEIDLPLAERTPVTAGARAAGPQLRPMPVAAAPRRPAPERGRAQATPTPPPAGPTTSGPSANGSTTNGPTTYGSTTSAPPSASGSSTNGSVIPAMNGTSTPRATGPTGGDDAPGGELTAADVLSALGADGVPHEPSLTPVRPSTTRPEFTALLDQLRDETRPRQAPRDRRTEIYLDRDPATQHASAPAGEPTSSDVATVSDVAFDAPPPLARRPEDPRPPVLRARPAEPEPTTQPPQPPQPSQPPQPPQPPLPQQAGPSAVELDDEPDPGPARRSADRRAAADRRTLRALGVPVAWTRRLRGGDRFGEVLRMLERMPEPDIDLDTPIVAVVGTAPAVRLEAHRTALDLATDAGPRPVVEVSAAVGAERAGAIGRALRSGPVVLAVEIPTGYDPADVAVAIDTLATVQAGAVIAVVDTDVPLERTQRWLDALGQVDALAVDGATATSEPAACLQLGLPVVRLDGIPVDRVTWTALLCGQLLAQDAASAPAAATGR